MEYIIKFYDTGLGIVRNITGLVENIYNESSAVEPCIQIKYIENESCTVECKSCTRSCVNKNNNKAIPICNCVLNPPSSTKYKSPINIYIPMVNILDIKFNRENMSPSKGLKHERGTKVMILGISATAIKAIVIHLEFFDDCLEKAVKYVDLAVDNVYDLSYLSKKSNSIFEIRGKLISIQECVGEPCKNGKGFVREIICPDNSIVSNCTEGCKKDFMKAPPVKKIKLTFDTSEDFSGYYETITLDSIRDCELVSDDTTPDSDANEEVSTVTCTCSNNNACTTPTCEYYKNSPCCSKSDNTSYLIGDYKIIVDGDKIKVDNNGEKSDIDMSEVLKFYFGV